MKGSDKDGSVARMYETMIRLDVAEMPNRHFFAIIGEHTAMVSNCGRVYLLSFTGENIC